MDDIKMRARESTHEGLLEDFGLLFSVINRSDDKDEIKQLSEKRDEINHELNRIELAKINSKLLPKEIESAIAELGRLTKELKEEKIRIKEAGEKIKKADEYIKQATEILKIAAMLFALV